MRTINEILDKIIEIEGLKNDAALAKLLNVKPNSVSTWRKRKTIPHDILFQYCDFRKYDIGWLLTGQITAKYINVDGKKVLLTEHGDVKEDDSAIPVDAQDVIKGDIYNKLFINHDMKGLAVGEDRSLTYGAGTKTNILRYPTELEPVVESFMAVMTSEDEDAKGSLARNVFTFHRTVTNERKIKKMEAEIFELRSEINNIKQQLLSMANTDFKTAELNGEKQGGGAN